MLRPVDIDKTFNLAIDAYICLWGGIIAPRLCQKELTDRLSNCNFLISLGSSFSDDTHISKQHYLDLCFSDDKVKEIGSIACSMTVVFAYESLKVHPKFKTFKTIEIVNFLRHLRNASAHGNRFTFTDSKSNKQIDPGSIKWRNKTIDISLENKIAIPDFICHGDLPYLLEDITGLLK